MPRFVAKKVRPSFDLIDKEVGAVFTKSGVELAAELTDQESIKLSALEAVFCNHLEQDRIILEELAALRAEAAIPQVLLR